MAWFGTFLLSDGELPNGGVRQEPTGRVLSNPPRIPATAGRLAEKPFLNEMGQKRLIGRGVPYH